MDGGADGTGRPFSRAISRWRHVGGAVDQEGNVVAKPAELIEAEVIEVICRRYHVLPDVARAADASILRHMAIIDMAYPPEQRDGE